MIKLLFTCMLSVRRLIITLLGVFIGVSLFTFTYAEGLSYFSTDPAACKNCHIMNQQYESWLKSSHHAVAGCVDCHLPSGFVSKYLAKAANGWSHSTAFTFGNFHEPILIKKTNRDILLNRCQSCHIDMTDSLIKYKNAMTDHGESDCLRCHSTVGHGPAAGLGKPLD